MIEGEQLSGHILLSPAGEADSSRQEASKQAQVSGQKGKGEDLTRGRYVKGGVCITHSTLHSSPPCLSLSVVVCGSPPVSTINPAYSGI